MRKYFLAVCLLIATPAFALDASDFSQVEGWTVAAVTQVKEEFEGCDPDRKIKFNNNWTLTCSNSSESHSYQPNAVIFVKNFNFQGHSYWTVKALIGEEFYDMEIIPAR